METVLETPTEVPSEDVIAVVHGQVLTVLPKDLYIPPDALEIFLEAFEGPLDLLLYLIKKQNIDILDIPIAEITRQYIEYVELMRVLNLELAAEYLVMAAALAEIKSRMLLPRPVDANTEEDDPRAELIRRLQEYERFKKAAEDLDALPRVDREIFVVDCPMPDLKIQKALPKIELKELLMALVDVFERAKLNAHHQIQRETLSLRERMASILNKVTPEKFTQFSELFSVEEGRVGVVVTFIAILELIRQSMLELIQAEPFGPIHVRAIAT